MKWVVGLVAYGIIAVTIAHLFGCFARCGRNEKIGSWPWEKSEK